METRGSPGGEGKRVIIGRRQASRSLSGPDGHFGAGRGGLGHESDSSRVSVVL